MLDHLGPMTTAARCAVLTGNPDRVPALAVGLGTVAQTWSRRGYVCAEVTDGRDRPLLVCSTGIGGPSAAIAVEELIHRGVTTFTRVGTCGALQPAVRPGHIVVSSGSVRDDGTSHQYLPASYPAVPDAHLQQRLLRQVAGLPVPHHVGVTHCKDAYYAECPEGLPMSTDWQTRWAALRALGVLATEMEAAALFAVAQVRRAAAAALFVPVDKSVHPDDTFATIVLAAGAAQRAMV